MNGWEAREKGRHGAGARLGTVGSLLWAGEEQERDWELWIGQGSLFFLLSKAS